MKKTTTTSAERASVLILVLWSLAFLTILAVNLGVGVRQQITLLSRLEKRETLRLAAHSGVEKARALVRYYFRQGRPAFTRQNKQALLGTPYVFKGVKIGNAVCDILYVRRENGEDVVHYGITNEEGKLNINTADVAILSRLFGAVFGFPKEKCDDLAARVVEWRETAPETPDADQGSAYGKVDYSYGPKQAAFERVEELNLIPGIDATIYSRLQEFVTVYGTGRVDLNTAPEEVLIAIGMSQALCEKILLARKGQDGIEGTDDDLLFGPDSDEDYIGQYVPLNDDDRARLRLLFVDQRIGGQAQYFRVEVRARFADEHDPFSASSDEIKSITSVFGTKDGRIVYWKEE